MYELLIRNGTIVDGTGGARYFGDVAIGNGVIEALGGGIPASSARRVIEADGKIVAPGHIDTHTHYDAQIYWDPYLGDSGLHGVTTVAIGNCGFGLAPIRNAPGIRDRHIQMLEHTEQLSPYALRTSLKWDWQSFPEFLAALRRTPKGINVAAYLPLNNLMMFVMGIDAAKTRSPTELEVETMQSLLREALGAGALGFSFSHMGDWTNHLDFDGSLLPGDAMNIEVAHRMAEVLRESGAGLIQVNCDHAGGVDNHHIVPALARISGQRVLFNLIGVYDDLPGWHDSRLAFLDEMEAQGLNVFNQGANYRAWTEYAPLTLTQWDSLLYLRTFSAAQDPIERLRIAADPVFRANVNRCYDPVDFASFGGPPETFVLFQIKSGSRFEKYLGQDLATIGRAENGSAMDAFFDMAIETSGECALRSPSVTSHNVVETAKITKHKRVVLGVSDGGAHNKWFAGAFYPTDAIKWFTRETSELDLETVHNRLSLAPARVLGLSKRGALLEGFAADLYIYDHDALDYPPSYAHVRDQPGHDTRVSVPSIGIEKVIVNGEVTLDRSRPTGATPGRVVSNKGLAMDARLAPVEPMELVNS